MLFIITVAVIFIYAANSVITPLLRGAAAQKARSISSYIISTAICDILNESPDEYRNITDFEKDINGKITALKTDAVKMNRLKAQVTVEVYEKLKQAENSGISIPLGSIFANGIFNSMGPEIKFGIKQSGAVETDFDNIFSSAGINQTNHRVMINVKASFFILMPFENVLETVTTSVCVAENVIVGDVPEAFTNVQNSADMGGETVADEIVDFGAQNFYGQ